MSKLLNMGMYELEEEQRRQMMERQKLDMLSAIAKSSDLTINQLRILNNKAQAPDDTVSSIDILD
jgi:ribosome maturation protein Sdo1